MEQTLTLERVLNDNVNLINNIAYKFKLHEHEHEDRVAILRAHIFHNLIKNTQERKIISFVSMLPGILILSLGFYLS